jgi:hypothetical protein
MCVALKLKLCDDWISSMRTARSFHLVLPQMFPQDHPCASRLAQGRSRPHRFPARLRICASTNPIHYCPTCSRLFAALMPLPQRLIPVRPISIATVLFASPRLEKQSSLQRCDSSPLFVREAGRAFGHWRRLVTASVAIDRR